MRRNRAKRGQRPSSLYYAVSSRVTDMRAVCRMHSGKPGGKFPRSLSGDEQNHPAFEDNFVCPTQSCLRGRQPPL